MVVLLVLLLAELSQRHPSRTTFIIFERFIKFQRSLIWAALCLPLLKFRFRNIRLGKLLYCASRETIKFIPLIHREYRQVLLSQFFKFIREELEGYLPRMLPRNILLLRMNRTALQQLVKLNFGRYRLDVSLNDLLEVNYFYRGLLYDRQSAIFDPLSYPFFPFHLRIAVAHVVDGLERPIIDSCRQIKLLKMHFFVELLQRRVLLQLLLQIIFERVSIQLIRNHRVIDI